MAPPLRRRWVEDSATARALAHPLRWQLLGLLRAEGPATATRLAARVGQSASNCSWHLRLLSRHGFVTRAPSASRRESPWQAAEITLLFGHEGTELPVEDVDALHSVFHEHEIQIFRRWWREQRRTDGKDWKDAAFSQLGVVWLTPAELEELGRSVGDVVAAADRGRTAGRRPPGARQVRVFAWGVPT